MIQDILVEWCDACMEYHAEATCPRCCSKVTVFSPVTFKPFTHMCPWCRSIMYLNVIGGHRREQEAA